MCVICYIPKGTELPSKKRIKAMWDTNSDGAGLFWIVNGKVHISKGYFDFDTFYKDILIVKDYDHELAIHMRIATSGGISKNMCHPFPISNKKDDLFKLYGSYDSAIMHNGVIHIQHRAEYSDTAEFIVSNLYSRYLNDKRFYKHLSPNATKKLEESINGSRLLFFGGDGSVKMIGNWTEKDGCYYSNLHFEWREKSQNNYSYKSFGCHRNYGYFDYNQADEDDDDDEIIAILDERKRKREREKEKKYQMQMQAYESLPWEE